MLKLSPHHCDPNNYRFIITLKANFSSRVTLIANYSNDINLKVLSSYLFGTQMYSYDNSKSTQIHIQNI
jgi:hypothetical protein